VHAEFVGKKALITLFSSPRVFTVACAGTTIVVPVQSAAAITGFRSTSALLAHVTRPLGLFLAVCIGVLLTALALARLRVESRTVLAGQLVALTDVAAVPSKWERALFANAQLLVQATAIAVLVPQRACVARSTIPRVRPGHGAVDALALGVVVLVKHAVVLAI